MLSLSNSIRSVYDVIISGLSGVIFAFMFFLGIYQIITRYLLNAPSTWSEELLTYAFVWMVMFGSAFIFGKREHMRMSFIADKIKGTTRRLLESFIELLIDIFSVMVMIAGGTFITNLTFPQVTASLGITMAYIYVIIPISGVLILVYSIFNLIEIWTMGYDDFQEIAEEAKK
ncbi:MAG: TRAP transporter small permease [Eggerthellaceae bacterium]|nr:TRAP transporter small permease [Eggerthellaceae bacterium]